MRKHRGHFAVCLLSAHPLVIADLSRLLTSEHFAVSVRRLNSSITDSEVLAVPSTELCLIDGNMPTAMLRSVVSQLSGRSPNLRLLVMLEKLSEDTVFALLQLGVQGFVSFSEAMLQLPRAIQMIMQGGYWVPRTLLSKFVESMLQKQKPRPANSSSPMSKREREVLEALVNNLSNKEIANTLNISERTVKFHVSNLLSKFGVQRRVDLIVLAYQDSNATSDKPVPMLVRER